MMRYFLLFLLVSSPLYSQPNTKFYTSIDHPTEVFTWYKQPDSGSFYSKTDESPIDPTVDLEYVYSTIDTIPVLDNKQLKLLIKYSENPIFSLVKFPSKTLNVRCSQTNFDGAEELYVSYTPASVNNKLKLIDEYTDNTIVFSEVGCPTDNTFSTISFDLGVDYGLPPEANGGVIEFRWSGCGDPNGCTVKISSVEVVWDNFKVIPIITE